MTPTEQDKELWELLAVNGLPHDSVEGSLLIDIVSRYFTDKLKNLPEMQMESVINTGGNLDSKMARNGLRTAILKSWEE